MDPKTKVRVTLTLEQAEFITAMLSKALNYASEEDVAKICAASDPIHTAVMDKLCGRKAKR